MQPPGVAEVACRVIGIDSETAKGPQRSLSGPALAGVARARGVGALGVASCAVVSRSPKALLPGLPRPLTAHRVVGPQTVLHALGLRTVLATHEPNAVLEGGAVEYVPRVHGWE